MSTSTDNSDYSGDFWDWGTAINPGAANTPWRTLTDAEWTYYGEGKSELVSMLMDDINTKKVYHGGGDNGYIGSVRGAYTPQQILEFQTLITQRYGRN